MEENVFNSKNVYVFMRVYRCELAPPTMPRTVVGVRGQLPGVTSLLPPCGFWELKSGRQAWQQGPLPTESSCQLDRRDFRADGNPDIVDGTVLYKVKGTELSLGHGVSKVCSSLGRQTKTWWEGCVWEFWVGFRTRRALYCYRTL